MYVLEASLFLQVGAAVPIEVLKFDQKLFQLVLQVPADWAVKSRAALTLQNSFQGEPCAYRVLKSSPNLLLL